jgi:hypothetical protein
MSQLIWRLVTVALMLLCATTVDHVSRHADDRQAATPAAQWAADSLAPVADAGGGPALQTAGQADMAHPCSSKAIAQQVLTGATELAVDLTAPAETGLALTALAADAAHPPGRCERSVLSVTCVHRS